MAFVLTVQIKRKKKMNNQKKFFRYFQVAALITVLSLFATLTFDSQPRAPIFHSVNGNIDILDCRSGRKTEAGIPRIQSLRKRSLGRGIRRQGKSAGNHRKGI